MQHKKEYTQFMEDKLFGLFEDEDNDESQVLKFLSDSETLRAFGEGLSAVVESKMPSETAESPRDYLLHQCKEKGLKLNRTTVDNWFSGEVRRPRKGEDTREHMFIIAFALNLSPSETSDFFHKIYLDHAFNFRSKEEVVYYSCLERGQSYHDAQRLINRIKIRDTDTKDGTVFTRLIKEDIQSLGRAEDIVDYIEAHSHNFQINRRSAKEEIDKLIFTVKGKPEDKMAIEEKRVDANCGIVIQEYDRGSKDGFKGENITSTNFMCKMILGLTFSDKESRGTKSIFGSARLPEEIRRRFPVPHTFSKAEPTSEELRKMIILLFSYKHWFHLWSTGREGNLDDYVPQLNDLLEKANLALLYFGNPYDWLFLYCAMQDKPLDTFRGIIAETIEQEY